MTDQEIRFINLVRQYAATKGYTLETVPPTARNPVWDLGFTNGREHLAVSFFDDQLIKEAYDGKLSEASRRNIDDSLI